MGYSKTQKILFALLCLFIILFPFWCVRGLCAEDLETIEPSIVSNIGITSNSNYFVETNASTAYIPLESGYIYHIKVNTSYGHNLALSSSEPSLNAPYTFLTFLPGGESYNYLATDATYLYLSSYDSYNVTFSREKVLGMRNAINDLVSNVGIDNIWNIFNISVNYIVIVVLVAFGIFIIIKIIRAISKGKEGL